MSDAVAPGERIRPSATVILTRRSPDLEIYLAERSRRTRFFPGYHVFPGGVLDASDGIGPDARRTAALRELFEETGVLVLEGGVPPGFPREEARARLAKGESIADLMAAHDARWDCAALEPAGNILTPPFSPIRFDTDFYVLELPAGEEPTVDGAELVRGSWVRPADALAAWNRHELMIPPPTLAYLHVLHATGDPHRAAAFARSTDGRPHYERFRIEFHPGVYVLPLRAPTLPPATTQNCYLLDSNPVLVVDPGTPYENERPALHHTLDEMTHDGRRVVVALTHHHADHVSSVADLKARYGAHVLAHADTARLLAPGLVDEVVDEGHELDLGTWGGRPWRLRVLHAPGHTRGHLVLRDERWGAMFVGDVVSGVSTILIDPEEGDMGTYMRTLDRLATLDPPLVLAGHGPALPGKSSIVTTLEHRRMREGKVRLALGREPRSLDQLLPLAYEDTAESAWMLAARSLESHLRKLEREGLAVRESGDRWRAA